jgi:hypothetical protein
MMKGGDGPVSTALTNGMPVYYVGGDGMSTIPYN